MSRYTATLRDENGVPITGAKVYVYVRSTGALAALTDDTDQPLGNPVTSDQYGGIVFNAGDGLYDLTYHYAGRERLIERAAQVGSGPVLPTEIVVALEMPTSAALVGSTGPSNVQADLNALDAALGALPNTYATKDAVTGLSTLATVTASDDFDRTNRLIHGDTAPNGAVYSVSGIGTPSTSVAIVDGRLTNPASKLAYISLALGAQPRRLQMRVRWVPTGVAPSNAAIPFPAAVMILTDNSGITQNSIAHVQCTPGNMTLDTFFGGASSLGRGGVGDLGLAGDGSEYQYAIELNADATEITSIAPDGRTQVETVSENSTLNCTNLVLEFAMDPAETYAAVPEILGYDVGEVNHTNRALALGSPSRLVLPPQGLIWNRTPIIMEHTLTANGTYRILTGGSGLGGIGCNGMVRIEAEQTGAPGLNDFIEVDVRCNATTQTVEQIDRRNFGSIITHVIASHNGSTSAAVDVTITGASGGNPVKLRVYPQGLFSPNYYPAVGATALTSSFSMPVTDPPVAQKITWVISAAGYARLIKGLASFEAEGSVYLYAFDTGGRQGWAQIGFGGRYDRAVSITKIAGHMPDFFGPVFDHARVSRHSGTADETGLALDVSFPNAAIQPVTCTAQFAPLTNAEFYTSPATAVSALATENAIVDF